MASTKSIKNKRSEQYHNNVGFLGFLYESYFFLDHFYFKCYLKNP